MMHPGRQSRPPELHKGSMRGFATEGPWIGCCGRHFKHLLCYCYCSCYCCCYCYFAIAPSLHARQEWGKVTGADVKKLRKKKLNVDVTGAGVKKLRKKKLNGDVTGAGVKKLRKKKLNGEVTGAGVKKLGNK
eukprot:1139692-Pelagomonas_calceolata.AAC.6